MGHGTHNYNYLTDVLSDVRACDDITDKFIKGFPKMIVVHTQEVAFFSMKGFN